MKHLITSVLALAFCAHLTAQTEPVITAWLQNTTGTGTYYVAGNSTPINNGILYNTQEVCYTANDVYITTTGVPAYHTAPFLDGNPNLATNQNAIFKFPLVPTQNTGTPTETTGGNIGVFINGVALFDYRDGVAWNSGTSALCGGPGNSSCPPGATNWTRDAVPSEMDGFDCSKGHPANGNYHHHQNPTAFNLDLSVLSNICDLYDSDALYAMNAASHSPLIGFAYDGYPIYGAMAYANANGTGGITRIKSGYQLRNITVRTHHADGTNVADGPDVSTTYFLGYFREDYEFISNTAADYLDEHNGRFAVTPEYPGGTYAYYATVDANWNSAYPYVVGPTFYGIYANRKVTNITESTTIYSSSVVPIELVNFEAEARSAFNLLSWVTANELNNAYFEIERSFDGALFESIGKIDAKENPDTYQLYSFKDEDLIEGQLYYRLTQFDIDGKASSSKVISIQRSLLTDHLVTVFPNPSSDFIAIQINTLVTRDIEIYIFSQNGKLIDQSIIKAGSTINYFDAQTLYDGSYFVMIKDGKNSFIRQVQIQH